jgi:hypothetical protein
MKLKKIGDWFANKPATKAAWIVAFAAILALILNAYLLYQNSQAINSARNAVLLSIDPTIDIEFRSDSVFIMNTSTEAINDIRIHPITYKIQPEPFKILDRNQPGGYYSVASQLTSKQRISISGIKLLGFSAYNTETDDPNIIRVIVITFRREVDQKRFSAIEIFYATLIDKKLSLFPVFSGKNTAVCGPPDYSLRIITEIERIERVLFKSDNFL